MTTFVEAQAPNIPTQSSTLDYSDAATAAATNGPQKSRSAQQQPGQQSRISYCYLHGYGGHIGSKCRQMLKEPKLYEAHHLTAATHTAMDGGSIWRKLQPGQRFELETDAAAVINPTLFSSLPSSLRASISTAYADTGCTHIFLRQCDAASAVLTTGIQALTVILPNNDCITSIDAGTMAFPYLSTPLPVHIFSDSSIEHSLLSILALCNLECTATFTKQNIKILLGNNLVATASKSPIATLWQLHLPSSQHTRAHAAFSSSSDKDFVVFALATFGSPAISTYEKAISRGYLSTFPRLSTRLLNVYPPQSQATAQGHLDQCRQGQDSTKSSVVSNTLPDSINDASQQLRSDVFIKCITTTQTAHSDLTGRFPIISRTGNQYILVSTLDRYIHVQPMKSRHRTEYIKAYAATIKWFTDLGHKPVFQRLDDETSIPLEAFIKKLDISIQYCPLSQHQALRAERAIRTFKNHAILNILHDVQAFPNGHMGSPITTDTALPQLSIYRAEIHGGQHNFRAHPIVPAGTRILIHDKSTHRTSWAPHGVPGFYLGPAHTHYCYYTVWATPTNSVRITDIVAWFPEQCPMPHLTPSDAIIGAVKDLSTTIATYAAVKPLFMPPIVDPILHELCTLAQMYQSATPITSPDNQNASTGKVDIIDITDSVTSKGGTSIRHCYAYGRTTVSPCCTESH